MIWTTEETGTPGESTLVLTVTKRERQWLKAAQRRDELGECRPRFDSDDFLYDLLEPMFTDDCFTWLPEGTTADMTSAPMVGILGEEMAGPARDFAVCSGLHHCGRWDVDGELREMYQPVLSRWAYMEYALSSPQRELAETGRCEWQGGVYWENQETAAQAVAEFEARAVASTGET